MLLTSLFKSHHPEKKSFSIVYFAFLFILILSSFYKVVLPFAAQNRIDQTAWEKLIQEVYTKAPPNAHILLQFDEPYMIETAESLEANTLLLGRYDLTYHLEVEDISAYKKDLGFLKYIVDSYNYSRKKLPEKDEDNILFIKADRKGGGGSPYLNYQFSINHPL